MTKIIPISKFTINGNSMLPTLKPGQDILSFNWAYMGRKPKEGDVVVIKIGGKEMVKRVSKISRSKIFVEGDNKRNSTDSRHFGEVSISQIVGKVVYPSTIDYLNCGFKLTCCGEP